MQREELKQRQGHVRELAQGRRRKQRESGAMQSSSRGRFAKCQVMVRGSCNVRAHASGCVCICEYHFHKPASLPGLLCRRGAMRKPRLLLSTASSTLSFLCPLSLYISV